MGFRLPSLIWAGEFVQGRTSVVVAHRLSTIRSADSIAVIQDGTVIEEGSHDHLLARPDGAYAHLVRLQRRSHS